jgi:hypothetical protein
MTEPLPKTCSMFSPPPVHEPSPMNGLFRPHDCIRLSSRSSCADRAIVKGSFWVFKLFRPVNMI